MTYQEQAHTFAKYGDNVEYPFLALGEEAGEVLGKLAKYVRKNNCSVGDALLAAIQPNNLGEQTLREDLIKELGDVLWQINACCTELGVTVEHVQRVNISKLTGRDLRDTIIGEGDCR